jgi:hypothetical protein
MAARLQLRNPEEHFSMTKDEYERWPTPEALGIDRG